MIDCETILQLVGALALVWLVLYFVLCILFKIPQIWMRQEKSYKKTNEALRGKDSDGI